MSSESQPDALSAGNLTATPPPRARRGGARPGAGRPKQFDRLVRSTISLPASYWGVLMRLGNGNASEAVRQLIDDAGLVP